MVRLHGLVEGAGGHVGGVGLEGLLVGLLLAEDHQVLVVAIRALCFILFRVPSFEWLLEAGKRGRVDLGDHRHEDGQ